MGVDADLNRYKLVVLPMLFMTKPGFAQKIREYVENGGTVVATYLLGYVDESTLCWLGGFPGDGLREVFGVTASELDTCTPARATVPSGSRAASRAASRITANCCSLPRVPRWWLCMDRISIPAMRL